ncbi:hypothetical protein CDL15_Pgr021476 [Punica granatum]|uniref:Uncharacterized protein n=1 Tax=Punica granatum TaxID=22663 RepID=A0A218XNK1_PUNGR|nr:hypothetical protein CDL15_Pgr021476 [Punica granatum]PKI39855.1 hypothetical protein CRG98_039760 [Punica granatum]
MLTRRGPPPTSAVWVVDCRPHRSGVMGRPALAHPGGIVVAVPDFSLNPSPPVFESRWLSPSPVSIPSLQSVGSGDICGQRRCVRRRCGRWP